MEQQGSPEKLSCRKITSLWFEKNSARTVQDRKDKEEKKVWRILDYCNLTGENSEIVTKAAATGL